jgi:TonB-linked SusC/RagA family outer membrane protein
MVPSSQYGPVTPRVEDPETGEVFDEGGGVVVTANTTSPAYARINRVGYTKQSTTNVYAQFALKLDMSFLTEGLNLSGHMAYQTRTFRSLYTAQNFANWIRTSDYSLLEFAPYGTNEDTPLSRSDYTTFYYNLTYKGVLDYKRSFGLHNVSGMAYGLYQNLNTADNASPLFLPYKRIHSGLEAAYNYDNRYFVKFDVSYSGSEQYAKENRFTFVPAVSAAWTLSNEEFMDGMDWLSLLKFRASYGKTANDRSNLGRYSYLDNINITGGGPLGYLLYHIVEIQTANPELMPEISVKQNYGIDMTFLGSLSLSADIFKERMDNMISGGTSITPAYQGIPLANFPKVNSGIFENKGWEIVLDYTKRINRDFSFNVGGWVAYSKSKNIFYDEPELSDDNSYKKHSEGYPVGQQWGYIVDKHNGNGYFNSQQEIDDSHLTYEIGTPRPGDLKYYDLNVDGVINDKDQAPLGFGALPLYTYAFHAEAQYKNFDLSVLFQGIGEYYSIDQNSGRTEYANEGIYGTWHKNAWTPERYAAGESITYPALSTQKNANHEPNSFFLEDKSYLRLKNLMIGYTLPKKIANAIAADNIRLYVNGQNLFTWHHLDTDDYGPEGTFLSVPVYRIYNIGLSVKF